MMEKKRRYSRKEEQKTPLLKYKGEKKIRKSCQTATKRDKKLFQNHCLFALVLVLKHTHNNSNKIMIGNYLSTMLVCVFAYLYPLFLCFKVCERTI